MTHQDMHDRYGPDADPAAFLPAAPTLRSSESRYRRLFETARHGILLLDFHTAHITDCNPCLSEILGYPPAELLGLALWEAEPFRNTALDQALFFQLQRSGHLQLDALTLQARQGNSVTVEFSAHVYEHEASHLVQCHVRQAARPEQHLRELTRQLEAARQNLESFSHSVTHDLRSPLGQIDGFAFLLGMEYADAKLDAKAQGYIQRIRAATKQMVVLIDNVWQLTRIDQAEVHPQPLDLSDMARALAIGAHPNVEFVITPGLAAIADIDLTRLALDSLFCNARQFTSQREHARIEFGLASHQAQPVYFIKDNGAGFDLAGNAPLFMQLQRLNSIAEFAGAGIRFALAERAIRRQGGEIRAESTPGMGAIFYFTL